MSLIPQFLASFNRLRYVSPDRPSSRLTRTAVAVADTLPGVEGSAICLSRSRGLRVPVAVSDGHSLLAEQLEFTTGFGPGLQARRAGQSIVAGLSLASRYAAFYDGLVTRTAFRAMVAIPLGEFSDDPAAVLLLYYGTTQVPDRSSGRAFTDITELAAMIGQAVVIQSDDASANTCGPALLNQPYARRRLEVEKAADMIMTAEGVPASDAMDLLRSHAYARGRLVDDTAHDLVTNLITVKAFQ